MIEIDKINSRIRDFKIKEGIDLVYCGPVLGDKSQLNYDRIIIENSTTGEKISCTCRDFITYHNYGWKDLVNNFNKRRSETLDRVNRKIEELKKKNIHVTFLGFDNPFLIGSNARLKLRNDDVNVEGTTSHNSFIRQPYGWRPIQTNQLNDESAIEKIKSVIKERGLNFEVLGLATGWIGYNDTLIIMRDLEFDEVSDTVNYGTFMKSGWSGKKREDYGWALKRKKVIEETIQKRIKQESYPIEFVGYKEGFDPMSVIEDKIVVILRDVEYNEYREFRYGYIFTGNKNVSIIISKKRSYPLHKTERKCGEIIEKFLESTNERCERHHRIKVVSESDQEFCNRKTIVVDYYIPTRNTIIEYDGEQHFQNVYFKDFYNNQDFVNSVNRDHFLERYCKENNINLLRISYKNKHRLEEVINTFLETGEDISTHVDPILLPAVINN